jgi:hypothetical protein
VRACFPPKNGGKDCPPPESKEYSESAECMERKCIGKKGINYLPAAVVLNLGERITGILLSLWKLHELGTPPRVALNKTKHFPTRE